MRAGQAVLEEDGVHPVFQRAAVLDQVQPEAGALPLGAHRRVGQPELGHEIGRASSASTQQSIRSVLQASGASPRALTASATRTSQPASSSWSCTKRAPVIDSITASTARARRVAAQDARSPSRRAAHAPTPTRSPPAVERLPIETLAAEIQSDVQHRRGLPSLSSDARSVPPREALLHHIPSGREVGRAGIEPATLGLRVPCSAN